ncbi:Potassium transporter 10 [Forsythia ovata]|uniref:Potassium transporter 10 n=1 Tax=Forsythia ovata TaxID=205694 RepID=A0ABD1QCV2_9LAMI
MESGLEIEDGNVTKGDMWVLDQKLDQPMEEEAGRLRNMYREKKFSSILLLRLAFQSLGVVYGDLGTSPLYVFYNTFPNGIDDTEDVIGALSLIIYSLTLIPLLKYVFIVCRANDNGQGGTFALYSLLCRHAKVKIIPNQHRTDEELTTYSRSTFHELSFAAKTKRWLEVNTFRKNALLILVLVGTCMVIGDGILTPAISVLSASGGIKVDHPKMSNDVVVLVAVVILVGLFSMQHYGTDKVGLLFAPIVLLWFLLIGGIGIFNICKYDSSVLKAFSPVYIYRYFKRGGKAGWTSLGGIMLSITGTEALFADLAHFPVSAIQLAFTVVVFPCLLLAYSGQAAYLMQNKEHVIDAFYRSIPGTAVVIVMLATTLLMTLIMLLVWHCHWIFVLIFTVLSLAVECTYFSAVLFKVDQGGWVPLVIAAAFLVIMYVWHYGTVKRYEFEMHSKVSMAWILGLGPSLGLVRVPGIGLVYTELANGVPHIFSHFITNLPAIHSVVVFVCVKYLPVYTVSEEERFLVKRIGPKNFHMFRCVARYGYKDLHKKDDEFEKKIFENLFMFVRLESMMEGCSDSEEYSLYGQQTQQSRDFLLKDNAYASTSNIDLTISSVDSIMPAKSPPHANNTIMSSGRESSQTEVDELEFLSSCRDSGVVHILGNTVIRARRDSGIHKKIAIDYIYAFLRKICRENSVIFNVPHESLLNVGQVLATSQKSKENYSSNVSSLRETPGIVIPEGGSRRGNEVLRRQGEYENVRFVVGCSNLFLVIQTCGMCYLVSLTRA